MGDEETATAAGIASDDAREKVALGVVDAIALLATAAEKAEGKALVRAFERTFGIGRDRPAINAGELVTTSILDAATDCLAEDSLTPQAVRALNLILGIYQAT